MIVIDVGCATHPGQDSTGYLIERFRPDTIYGFDPHPSVAPERTTVDGTIVDLRRAAAWVRDGNVRYFQSGSSSRVAYSGSSSSDAGTDVPCIDLAAFIAGLPDEETVLKLDAEGSEYALLDRLISRDLTRSLALILVEWHPEGVYAAQARREQIEATCRCKIEEWPL